MPGIRLFGSSLPLSFYSRASQLQCKPALQSMLHSRSLTVASTRTSNSKDVTERPLSEEEEKSKEKLGPTSHDTSSKMVRTQYIDKKSLVWDKRYKSVEDVPEMLPYQTIVQARNRFRIRANLVMIGLTVLAALVMIYTGKERAKTGDTVEKRTLERHRQLRLQKAEEDRAAQAAAAQAAAAQAAAAAAGAGAEK